MNLGPLEAEKIGLGDLVKLRSGGPTMTVHFTTNSDATCFWFPIRILGDGEIEYLERPEKETFSMASLKKVTNA